MLSVRVIDSAGSRPRVIVFDALHQISYIRMVNQNLSWFIVEIHWRLDRCVQIETSYFQRFGRHMKSSSQSQQDHFHTCVYIRILWLDRIVTCCHIKSVTVLYVNCNWNSAEWASTIAATSVTTMLVMAVEYYCRKKRYMLIIYHAFRLTQLRAGILCWSS